MKSDSNPSRFSTPVCIGAFIFHIFVTGILVTMAFAYGMGSFTEDTSSQINSTSALLWIWTPLAMATWNPEKINLLLWAVLSLTSSTIFAIAMGFIEPIMKRKKAAEQGAAANP
jgi:hypothetical protein